MLSYDKKPFRETWLSWWENAVWNCLAITVFNYINDVFKFIPPNKLNWEY